jgi:hypothetical protein
MGLKCLFDFLRVFLGLALLEYLWHRFDKLFRLQYNQPTTKRTEMENKNKIERREKEIRTDLGGEQRETRTSMRVRFGTSALTSLMTFGLALASNDSSFTLKIVFSFGLAAASSAPASSAASAPVAPLAPVEEGAVLPGAGSAIS